MKRILVLPVVLLAALPPCLAQDKGKTFPTEDEIRLLLTQAERAVQQYKPLIDQEEIQMGKRAAEAVAKDREVVTSVEMALKALKDRPDGFNGPAGFVLFEWLDDADRNALLCASSTLSESVLYFVAGDTNKAQVLQRLSQSCLDASTLIYTVSESAGALYQRYAEAERDLVSKSGEVAEECMKILKQNGLMPRK